MIMGIHIMPGPVRHSGNSTACQLKLTIRDESSAVVVSLTGKEKR